MLHYNYRWISIKIILYIIYLTIYCKLTQSGHLESFHHELSEIVNTYTQNPFVLYADMTSM